MIDENGHLDTKYVEVPKTTFTHEEAMALNRSQRRELGKMNGNVKILGSQKPYIKNNQ